MPFFTAMGYRPTHIVRDGPEGSLMAVHMQKTLAVRVAVAA
jgi:hypothetical protein